MNYELRTTAGRQYNFFLDGQRASAVPNSLFTIHYSLDMLRYELLLRIKNHIYLKMGVLYQVKEGDTLFKVAKKYNVPAYIIGRENGVKEIKAGMRLIIPSPSGIRYVVKPFETIESIAKDYFINPDFLKEFNKLDRVFFGQVIFLPFKQD
jgi:LysM repeat protein